MKNLYSGLIYTNDNCTGCNRCISVCPVEGACKAVNTDTGNRVFVDGDLCKYMKINDKLAFISPCIAKKKEINKENNKGYVSYNVTFTKLIEKLKDINLNEYEGKDKIEYGLGSIYPMPGGLKSNVEFYLGNENIIRQVEGQKHVYDYLEQYRDRIKSNNKLPFIVDALNCSKGCIYGTATDASNVNNDDILFEIENMKKSKSIDSVEKIVD